MLKVISVLSKMDILKAIKSVRNVNDYITLTHDIVIKDTSFQIPLNMTYVLGLKKICSFEVEYFHKCQEVGAAFMIFERMLKLPPSKTWSLLGKDLVALLYYWIEALRKHLIAHCPNWWMFLKSLLKFIKDIGSKDITISNTLVEQLSECLLYIATCDRLDLAQRIDVIRCLNQCCITSARDVRMALGNKLSGYFIKLSEHMATCGHFPTQLSTMELLLRWLLKRHDRSAREVAALKWFPRALYSEQAVGLFVERSFMDFYRDARDFLNAHNASSDKVISVVCRRLVIGNVPIISDKDPVQTWLDINSGASCLNLIIDPRILQALGLKNVAHELLTVNARDTMSARLFRESSQVQISITTANGPEFMNESTVAILDDSKREIKICISGRCDLQSVNDALRRALGENYACALDNVNAISGLSLSPQDEVEVDRKFSVSEEEAHFSSSYQVPVQKAKINQKRRKRSGYMTKTRQQSGWKSPSSISTTSLVQLHDKLAALPKIVYDKGPVSVLAQPDLSSVTELSEPDEASFSTASTFKLWHRYGVAHKSRPKIYGKSKTSPSDNEDCLTKKCIFGETNAEEKSTSCLFIATVGSTDESVINDTLEHIKNKDPDLVNLLFRETDNNKEFLDSGINTGENGKKTQDFENSKKIEDSEIQTEVIENTPIAATSVGKKKIVSSSKKENPVPCTVISKSTSEESNVDNYKPINPIISDESNADTIVETPRNYVNVRRKNLRGRKDFGQSSKEIPAKIVSDDQLNKRRSLYNIEDMEDFFSQHFKENQDGDLIVSPTLARKINLSSSETSDSFDRCLISNTNHVNADINQETDADFGFSIIDCLNSMVDKVCDEFDKCAEYFDQANPRLDIDLPEQDADIIEPKQNIDKETKVTELTEKTPIARTASPKSATIKITYKKNVVPKKQKVVKKRTTPNAKNKLKLEPPKKTTNDESTKKFNRGEMPKHSPIIHDKTETKETSETEIPLPKLERRKRKLYSPKDNDIEKVMDDDEIIPLSEYKKRIEKTTPKRNTKLQTPKSVATCYLEIEEVRKKYVRQPRNRKSRTSPSLSPKTIKYNTLFDNLKDHLENNNVKLMDKKSSEKDIAIYNFTSDSEDDDFKQKKIDLKNRKSTATLGSNESATTRQRRAYNRVNYSESKTNSSAEDAAKTKKEGIRKRATKRQNNKGRGRKPKIVKNLEDERMRSNTPVETISSPVTVESRRKVVTPAEPKLNIIPALEVISEVSFEDKLEENLPDKKVVSKKKKALTLSIKKEKGIKSKECAKETTDEESPLPALIIETVPKKVDDDNVSSASSNLMKKCNKLRQFGEEDITDTTQNLLSDLENIYYSPARVEIEYTENLEIKHVTEDIETIELEETIQKTGSQEKTKAKKSEIHCIDNSVVSDKSIDTIGKYPITAHGDGDESPPNTETLKQNIVPRNFDLEHMSLSMQNYFKELSSQVKENIKTGPKIQTKITKKVDDTPASKQSSKKDESSAPLSPLVSIKRLTEDDFRKWLPSPRSSVSDESQSHHKKTIENSPVLSLRMATRCSQKHTQNEERKKEAVDVKKTVTAKSSRDCVEICTEQLGFDLPETSKAKRQLHCQKRKSVISPIDICMDEDENADLTVCLNNQPSCDVKEQPSPKPVLNIETMKKYCLKSMSEEKQSINESPSPPKRRKIETNKKADIISIPSVQSVESVREWFLRDIPIESPDDVHFACKECIQNVMEKLDTTLIEIQQNTTKKFAHMFVEMQKSITELEDKRAALFKEKSLNMMKLFMQVFETNVVDIQDECEKLNADFQQKTKRRAVDLMREDSKQKRALVTILYEDIEAAYAAIQRLG